MNEMRALLEDMNKANLQISQGYLPRQEYNAKHGGLEDKLSAMASRMDKSEGRTLGLNATWIYISLVMAAVTSLVSIVMQLAHAKP
jgi:hypothetical protein